MNVRDEKIRQGKVLECDGCEYVEMVWKDNEKIVYTNSKETFYICEKIHKGESFVDYLTRIGVYDCH